MGCILYQLLFKKHPFQNATIITDNWTLPRGRTKKEPLITLLCECLQLLPADRPTASSLVICFDAVAEGNPLPKRDYGARPAVPPVAAPGRLSTQVTATASPRPAAAAVPVPPADCPGVKLHATVRRGEKGMGFALNSDNCVAMLVEGGQAEEDGLLELGDTVLAVDGILLEGRPMGEVISRGHDSYEFVLLRRDPAIQVSMSPSCRKRGRHTSPGTCIPFTSASTAGEPRAAARRQPGPCGSRHSAAAAPTRCHTRRQRSWPRHEWFQRAEEGNGVLRPNRTSNDYCAVNLRASTRLLA